MTPLSLILILSLSAGCVLAGRILFHYFQLESYQHPGYFRTIRRNALKAFLPGLIEALAWALRLSFRKTTTGFRSSVFPLLSWPAAYCFTACPGIRKPRSRSGSPRG